MRFWPTCAGDWIAEGAEDLVQAGPFRFRARAPLPERKQLAEVTGQSSPSKPKPKPTCPRESISSWNDADSPWPEVSLRVRGKAPRSPGKLRAALELNGADGWTNECLTQNGFGCGVTRTGCRASGRGKLATWEQARI